MSVGVESVALRRDRRGLVFELVAADELAGYRSIHVVVNEAGAVRGNHRHLQSTECLIVDVPTLVRLRDEPGLRDVRVGDREVVRFRIGPGVSPATRNTDGRPRIILVLQTAGPDGGAPDVSPDLLINPASAEPEDAAPCSPPAA